MDSPAFQFYPKQWLGDDKVLLMDWDARAMHMHLMCIAWQQEQPCTIPDDDVALKRWCGDPLDWPRLRSQILSAWTKQGGRWVQRGLLREYLKQEDKRRKRQAAANKRWHGESDSPCMPDAYAKDMLSRAEAEDVIEDEDRDGILSDLITTWNEVAAQNHLKAVTPSTVLKPTTEAGKKRRRVALARLKEHPDLGEWRTVIDRIAARAYCRGENDAGWTADFTYLTRVETFDAHLTGKFSTPAAKRPDPGRHVDVSPWHLDDVRDYGNGTVHPQWDAYLDAMAGRPAPWQRFKQWLSTQEGEARA